MALRCFRKRRLRSSELPFRQRLPALGFLLLLYSKLATKATISLKCAVLPARGFILSHRPTVCFSNITGNPATLKFQIGLCVHASIGGVFFLSARRYASVVRATALYVCVSPCLCHKSDSKWMNESSWFLAQELPSILHCVKRKFGYLKIGVLHSGSLSRHINRRNVLST